MKFIERLSIAKTNPILLDGAMGTELQKHDPTEFDYPGKKVGFSDGLTLSKPEWIQAIHESYLKAGSDCITTNTFGSTGIKLQEYGYENKITEINAAAVKIAKDAILDGNYENKFILGSMGPTGWTPSMDCTPEMINSMRKTYADQAKILEQAGVDALLIETSQDVLEAKAAIDGIKSVTDLPLLVNITLAMSTTMLFGTPAGSAYATLSSMRIDSFGINCSTGPTEMEDAIRWLDDEATHPIAIVPNAGIPENTADGADFPMQPDELSTIMGKFLEKYESISIIGGCCGTTPRHISELRNIF